MFSLPPKVTKELLLQKNSQETYFEHYLGIPVKNGLFCSPSFIRNDKTPTCAFYKNKKGVLMYKDFAGPTFDFIGAVMYLFNCNYHKALDIIANDFNIVTIPDIKRNKAKITYSGNILKKTEKSNIQVQIKDFSKKELRWWYSFGISKKTLKLYNVYSVKHIFLNGNYYDSSTESSPVFGYYGGKTSEGIELWRLYRPTKRKYRFLSNWNSFILQGAQQLPKYGSHLIIIKSMKDLMLLYEFGFNSCAGISENILIPKNQYFKITDRFNNNVFVFFDNDLAGVKGAKKYKKKYNTKCIFIKRKYAKDISDLYKKVSSTTFWKIIDELTDIISKDNINNTKHFYIF